MHKTMMRSRSGEEYRSTNEELQITKEEVDGDRIGPCASSMRRCSLTNGDLSAASTSDHTRGQPHGDDCGDDAAAPCWSLSGPLVIERMNQAFLQVFGGDRLREVGLLDL
jgi:hypothetical protein